MDEGRKLVGAAQDVIAALEMPNPGRIAERKGAIGTESNQTLSAMHIFDRIRQLSRSPRFGAAS